MHDHRMNEPTERGTRRTSGRAPQRASETAICVERIDLLVPDVPEAVHWFGNVLGLLPLTDENRSADPERVLPLSADGRTPVIGLVRGSQMHATAGRIVLRVPGRALPRIVRSLETEEIPNADGEPLSAADLVDLGHAWSLRFSDPWGHPIELRIPDHALVRAWLDGQAIAPDAPAAPPRHEVDLTPRAMVDPPHPATLEDAILLKQCRVSFGRSSGPGGQHRNRVETAAELTHLPTGIQGWASERRKQAENRSVALKRLRTKLAMQVRTHVSHDTYRPSPLWVARRQGTRLSINPDHREYPALLAEALDVIVARRWDVAGAAGLLGVTMSQLSRLLRHERHAFALVNEGRIRQGLPALK